MTENENKIIYQGQSIEKSKLFAISNSSNWKIARIEMMMILQRRLKMKMLEAHRITNQLRPEREAFYSLID